MENKDWVNKFIKDKLPEYDSISSIETLDNDVLKIKRKRGEDFKCFCISSEEVSYRMIKDLIDNHPEVDFIANIKKDFLISGDAMSIMNSKNISFGSFGDLIRFSNQTDNKLFIEKEYQFVSRGLNQHDKIKHIERLDNKRIKVERHGLSEVIIVMNNDYDLNSESVRKTKDKYGNFKVILATNPNVRITNDAYGTAKLINVDICKYAEFLEKINSL